MASASFQGIVVRDGDGNFYEITPELLQQAKVPANRAAEVKERLQSGEVSGYGYDPTTGLWNPDPVDIGNTINLVQGSVGFAFFGNPFGR